jgi:hypothetical protein
VEGDHPRTAALRPVDPQQPPFEVDVIPIEPEKLGAAKARVGEERKQEAIALPPPRVVALPDVVAVYGRQKPRELALVRTSGRASASG